MERNFIEQAIVDGTPLNYRLLDRWELKGVRSAQANLEKVKDFNRFCDMTYLDLLLNLREFEEKELPMMRMVSGLLPAFLGSYDFFPEAPEKSPEEIEFRNRCYDMWAELDKITIVIDDRKEE